MIEVNNPALLKHENILTKQIRNEYRRYLIENEIPSRVQEIKNTVRENFLGKNALVLNLEQRRAIRQELQRAETLCQRLIEDELLIDEDFAELADSLGKQLREKFDLPGLALVLIGSGVHGGLQLRKLFSTEGSSDFDWGVVSDRDFADIKLDDPNSLDHIVEFVKMGVKAYAAVKDRELHSCESMNGFEVHEQNILSVQDLLSSILKMKPHEYATLSTQLVFYFQPSFPAEINQRNQEFILNTLRILANADHRKWSTLVSSMVESWKGLHLVKRKHVGRSNYKINSDELENKKHADLKISSAEAMSQRFREMLDTTGVRQVAADSISQISN